MSVRCLSREQLLDLVQEVVSRGGLLRFQAHGHSMRPAIADRDRVVLGPVGAQRPRQGEVVLARTRRGPRLHRVVAAGADADGPWLRVCGDTQLGLGETVRPEAVLARVVKVDRPLRRTVALYLEQYARRVPWLRPRAGVQAA